MRGARNFRQGGGGGGVQVNLAKKLTTFFLVLSLFYRRQMLISKITINFQDSLGGPTFSRVGGIQLFPGGGSNCLFPIENI